MTLSAWHYGGQGTSTDSLGPRTYVESKTSGKEQYTTDSGTANRVFYVNWGNRQAFLDDLLGYSYLDANDNVKRILPAEHPQIAKFYADSATITGTGVPLSDGSCIAWTLAEVTTNYRPRDFVVADDAMIAGLGTSAEMSRFTSRTSMVAGEFVTVQNGFKFVTSKRVLASPPGRITASQEITMVWHDVPCLIDAIGNPLLGIPPNNVAVNSCLGKLNNTNFDPRGYNYPPNTVLFVGVAENKMSTPRITTQQNNPTSPYMWTITLKFLYRNNGIWSGQSASSAYTPGGGGGGGQDEYMGHNFIMDATTGRWDLVTTTGETTGQRIYPETADLNELWTISS